MSSFFLFSLGALIALLPYLFGLESLIAALVCGAVGLLLAGAVASTFTVQRWWLAALRQLAYGLIAAGATYLVGHPIGVGAVG